MERRIIAVSTAPGMPNVWPILTAAGYRIEAFPADGDGGRALEAGVKSGRFAGVLDLALGEVLAELFGLPGGAGPDRLTAAAIAGVPQVLGVGGILGLTPEQADRLGLEIAQKACAAKGPTAILLSVTLHSQEAELALFQSLRNWSYGIEMIELRFAISDAEFSATAERTLLQMIGT